ncbi:MAG: hypothetical protein OER78_00390 [Nitrosopumilus sp.]|nr:hypothetical protein [Nitrosopumilus sp.]
MIESVETSLHALEYGLYSSLVTLRQRLRKRTVEPEFDPEILDAYR